MDTVLVILASLVASVAWLALGYAVGLRQAKRPTPRPDAVEAEEDDPFKFRFRL